MNTQPIEKQDLTSSLQVQVHSIFRTIQGEGPFTGRPAVFIRLAGCNLQCPGCDTDYTSNRESLDPWEIVDRVSHLASDGDLVVISGGEPFRQSIALLVRFLVQDIGMEVQIETNGTLYDPQFPYCLCTIVCAPKAGKVHKDLQRHISAYKYVLRHHDVLEDGLPGHVLGHSAHPHVARPHEGYTGQVYLQPEDAKDPTINAANLAATIQSCMKHGHTFSLQVHKIINME